MQSAVKSALSSGTGAGYGGNEGKQDPDDDSTPLLGTMRVASEAKDSGSGLALTSTLGSTFGSTLGSTLGGTGLAPLREAKEEGGSVRSVQGESVKSIQGESVRSIRSPASRRYDDDGNDSDGSKNSTDGFLTKVDGDD